MDQIVTALKWIADNWTWIAQLLGLVAAALTAIATAITANTKLQAKAHWLVQAAHVASWLSHQDARGWIGRFKLPGMRSTLPTLPPVQQPPQQIAK